MVQQQHFLHTFHRIFPGFCINHPKGKHFSRAYNRIHVTLRGYFPMWVKHKYIAYILIALPTIVNTYIELLSL